MHAAAAAATPTVDESKLPPCHRHKLHANPASKPTSDDNVPCIRAGCNRPDPTLTFFFLLGVPEPQHLELQHPPQDALASVQAPPDAPLIARFKPPPRSDA